MSESEVMPLVSYRVSAEGVLRWEHSDRVVTGLRWERSAGSNATGCFQSATECSWSGSHQDWKPKPGEIHDSCRDDHHNLRKS